MITNVLILLAILIILCCLALRERRKSVGKLYWHIHHDQLLEIATEPIARRIMCIEEHKPLDEIETRLRCLRPVKGTLPGEVVEAFRFYGTALKHRDMLWKLRWFRSLYHLSCKSCWKAGVDLRVTLQKYESEINRLHREECSCPWNGTTLFPDVA